MKNLTLAFTCIAVSIAASGRASADLVVNGSFETGDFTGWTLVGNPNNNYVTTGFAEDGSYAAFFGEQGQLGSLSQSLATTVGASYSLSFWFAGAGDTPSEFKASVGGTQLLDLVNPPLDANYVQYTYGFTATSTSTDLSFGFRDDANFINLDNVSVVAVASVPEPTSIALLGVGAIGLIGLFRRRKRLTVA